MMLNKITIICFAILVINVRKNQSMFYHKQLLRDCMCFPNDNYKPRASEIASTNGRFVRKVVYLYKHVDSGTISVYLPNPEKQDKFPDLTVGDTDKYGFPRLYNLLELFENETDLSSTIVLPQAKKPCVINILPSDVTTATPTPVTTPTTTEKLIEIIEHETTSTKVPSDIQKPDKKPFLPAKPSHTGQQNLKPDTKPSNNEKPANTDQNIQIHQNEPSKIVQPTKPVEIDHHEPKRDTKPSNNEKPANTDQHVHIPQNEPSKIVQPTKPVEIEHHEPKPETKPSNNEKPANTDQHVHIPQNEPSKIVQPTKPVENEHHEPKPDTRPYHDNVEVIHINITSDDVPSNVRPPIGLDMDLTIQQQNQEHTDQITNPGEEGSDYEIITLQPTGEDHLYEIIPENHWQQIINIPENPKQTKIDINIKDETNLLEESGADFTNIVQNLLHGKKTLTVPSHNIQIPSNPILDLWLTEQIKIINNDVLGLKIPDNAELQKFKYHVLNLISRNGYRFTEDGDILDPHGRILKISNLKLQRVMISDPAVYRQILSQNKCVVPHDIPYLEAVFVSLIFPPKILGVIPLKMTLLPKCKFGSSTDKNRPFDMTHTFKINWSPREGEVKKIDDAGLIAASESRSHSEIPEDSAKHSDEDIEAAFKNYLDQKDIDESDEVIGDTSSDDDDDEGLDTKIVGGNAATSSGTPVNSRGRSGYEDGYWFYAN